MHLHLPPSPLPADALLNLLMTSEEQQQPAAAGAQAAPEANADANADASDEEEEAGSTLMLWRREGDSWDEADSEDEEMAAEGGLISISQYSALCEQAARCAAPARPGPVQAAAAAAAAGLLYMGLAGGCDALMLLACNASLAASQATCKRSSRMQVQLCS